MCFDHDPFEFLLLAMHFFLAISQWLDGRAPRPERSVLPARELIFAALSDSGQIQQITEDQEQQNHMGLPPLEKCGSGKKHMEISRNHCLQELKEYWIWHTGTVLYKSVQYFWSNWSLESTAYPPIPTNTWFGLVLCWSNRLHPYTSIDFPIQNIIDHHLCTVSQLICIYLGVPQNDILTWHIFTTVQV